MTATPDWFPTASFETLKQRAVLIQTIRRFFIERGVLEVETPLLSSDTVTEPNIHSISTYNPTIGATTEQLAYLQTSPEFAMKRLLAAGSGAIFQICKAFRAEESGRLHNPEFTMLEWYRPGFAYYELMNEVEELLHVILNISSTQRISYQDVFLQYLNLNPHQCNVDELYHIMKEQGIQLNDPQDQLIQDDYLNLLMSHCIEPKLPKDTMVFIYDYPASQCALANIRKSNDVSEYDLAERFEVYINGIELANGFQELNDADEQAARFINELDRRKKLGLPPIPMDQRFISALREGLPKCSGVALGIDRLIMLALQRESISDVLSFTWENA